MKAGFTRLIWVIRGRRSDELGHKGMWVVSLMLALPWTLFAVIDRPGSGSLNTFWLGLAGGCFVISWGIFGAVLWLSKSFRPLGSSLSESVRDPTDDEEGHPQKYNEHRTDLRPD